MQKITNCELAETADHCTDEKDCKLVWMTTPAGYKGAVLHDYKLTYKTE